MLTLAPSFAERLSTGYYLPAGVSMKLKVLEGDCKGWKVRIGAHTDNIEQRNEYNRWCVISTVENFSQ